MDYTGLNEAQAQAVRSDAPRLLCLAGAGTGKTRVLTHRIARIFEDGVPAREMLALTFTRAAGAEMKERIIGLIGEEGRELFCNTYHAWAVRMIRRYSYQIGLTPSFTIYDEEDRASIITQIIEDMSYPIKPKDVLEAMNKQTLYRVTLPKGEIEQTVIEYQMRCKRYNSIDLDGLIAGLQTLLRNEMIQKQIHDEYKYIFVDEFQDTDHRQMEILEAINPENLFVVGDDFQSIYGFRGADVSIIMRLANDPEYETIKLEENYRSTDPIVTAANNLIKHNNQTEKVLKSHRFGRMLEIIPCEDEEDEMDEICGEISWLHSDKYDSFQNVGDKEPRLIKIAEGIPYNEIAILGRTNKKVQEAAEALEAAGIPYTIKTKASDPLMNHDAKKLFLWMSAILNPQDDVAISSILNWPEPTITRIEMNNAEMFQLTNDCSLKTALESTGAATAFLDIYNRINNESIEYYDEGEPVSAVDLLEYVIAGTEILDRYHEKGLTNRIAVINQIDDALRNWQEQKATMGEESTAEDWLDYYHLRMIEETERLDVEKEDAVQIMTAHGSKGLEFNTVFIIGCNEKSFPLGKGDMEEERRLFYVAITRAKERLYMTYPTKRTIWGDKEEETKISRFIPELDYPS